MTKKPPDSTAGRTARQIREHPNDPRRILDPTDPRQGTLLSDAREQAGAARIVDPTDPRVGSEQR
jgi:hypothetical protein